ncbi:MAG: PQQ-binding-like beta-propeller repeat protein [Planctomycetaceae bacterium]
MATLEIRYLDGTIERRELSKQIPLSIGSHPSSDVVITDEGVQPLHCRIAWKKNGYEVTAGSGQGVEVNGKTVSFMSLKEGDVLQVGQVDLSVAAIESAAPPIDDVAGHPKKAGVKSPKDDNPADFSQAADVELKPFTDDEIQLAPPDKPAKRQDERDAEGKRIPREPKRSQTGKKYYSAFEDNDDEDDGSGGDGGIIPILDPPSSRPDPTLVDVDIEVLGSESGGDVSQVFLTRGGEKGESKKGKADAAASAGAVSNEQIVSRLKKEFARARPGEQELLRSPMVLALGGGALVLLLLGLTFYFVIGRDQAQRHYDVAMGHFNSRDFNQAIPLLETFIVTYKGHRLETEARWNLSVAKVEQHISGSVPDWPNAIKALNDLLKEHRDTEEFVDRQPIIATYAETIAVGAAKSAGTALERPLLDVSTEALALVELNSPEDAPPLQAQQQVAAEQKKSEAVLRRHEALQTTLQQMTDAAGKNQTLEALRARQELLDRYLRDEYILGHADLKKALASVLTLEKTLVVQDDPARDALPAEVIAGLSPPVYLTPHARSRTNEQSENQVVFALAQDAVFALDTMTGVPRWAHTIGEQTPFFPRPMQTSVSGLLVYHSGKRELRCLLQNDGSIVWRQPLTGDLRGSPLLHEGQIYVATSGGNLWRIDQESGRLTSHLHFPHELAGGPALAGKGDVVVVAGEESVFYTLGLRPLECHQVTYLGHKPSTISAPLMSLGSMILAAENNTANGCVLRMLGFTKPDQPLTVAASQKVEGHVLDDMAIRGNQLFVPSSGERITVFTVSDEAGQPPLSRIAMFQVEGGQGGPIYVAAGPNGQLWMSSTAFRRLELEGDKIKPDPKQLAVGLSSQPLQMNGQYVYVGRKQPFSTAVYFAQVIREEMASPWRTIVGSPLLQFAAVDNDAAVFVNQTGDVFKVNRSDLDGGGFKLTPTVTLPFPENLNSVPRAATLENQKVLVGIGGNKPHAWLINSAGQIEIEANIDAAFDNVPFVWGGGVLMTSGGKIRLILRDAGLPAVEEFSSTSGADAVVRWRGVVAIDDEHLVAIDEQQKMVKLQLRQSTPPAHLAEVSAVTLDQPVDVPPILLQGKLCVADSSGQLTVWEASTFDRLHSVKLEQPAGNRMWAEGENLYVQAGTQKLICFQLGAELKSIWEVSLTGHGLAGAPLMTPQGILIAQTDGRTMLVASETGKIVTEIALDQRIMPGVFQLGGAMVAVGGDGSIRRIDGAFAVPSAAAAAKN